MCILFIHTETNPLPGTYRIIIVSNRDEFYVRPAAQIDRIKDVIGGRDMENGREGGMWLGISVKKTNHSKFRFAALLNVTGEHREHGVKGRGFIVSEYLDGEITIEEYMNALISKNEKCNGYNFVAVEAEDSEITVHHCSNVTSAYSKFDNGKIMGFGNTPINISLQKVLAGKKKFKEIIDLHNNVDSKEKLLEALLELLKWEQKHLPDEELQRRQPAAYEGLSSIFVKIPHAAYGSRTHSIILVDYEWNVEFLEATMKEPINIEQPVWLTKTIKANL